MAKVIDFEKRSAALDEIDLARASIVDGSATDMVIVYRKNTEEPGYSGEVHNFWFGTSSVTCMGLLEWMRMVIADWVRDGW